MNGYDSYLIYESTYRILDLLCNDLVIVDLSFHVGSKLSIGAKIVFEQRT